MELSNFELIYKTQSPLPITGTSTIDRVIQGYFLSITNLGSKTYKYRIEFVATPPLITQPFRGIAGNTLVFVDSPGADNQGGTLVPTLSPDVFRPSTGLVTVGPNSTALFAVLPSAFGPTPIDPTPLTALNFEVRGYVRITLPALFSFPQFAFVPQSDGPVKVLLTPQYRATYFTEGGAVADQTQASLPTASGAALNLLPAEPGGPIVLTPLAKAADVETVAEMMAALPDEARTAMLAALLGQVDPDRSGLKPFNDLLADARIPLAIERRKMAS